MEKRAKAKEIVKKYKVKLDYKTVIIIRDLKALATWKKKYPKAEVIATI